MHRHAQCDGVIASSISRRVALGDSSYRAIAHVVANAGNAIAYNSSHWNRTAVVGDSRRTPLPDHRRSTVAEHHCAATIFGAIESREDFYDRRSHCQRRNARPRDGAIAAETVHSSDRRAASGKEVEVLGNSARTEHR
jgi:hypothetical protein